MRKHIIIEGIDGSGKDTLIDQLVPLFPYHKLHPRASTSLGGPVPSLDQWTTDDVLSMFRQSPSIYNRHPLISEPIYAPLRQVNPGLVAPWDDSSWVDTYRRTAALHCVLVICDPAYRTVRENLEASGPDSHMPGVYENQKELYDRYRSLVWSGPTIRYDYTLNTAEALATVIRGSYDWDKDL